MQIFVGSKSLTRDIFAGLKSSLLLNTAINLFLPGPLLKQILDNMSAKSKGTLKPNHKMVLYSGHDFSILGLLGSITKSKKLIPQPEFGASLAFEMYRSESNQYTVKVSDLVG